MKLALPACPTGRVWVALAILLGCDTAGEVRSEAQAPVEPTTQETGALGTLPFDAVAAPCRRGPPGSWEWGATVQLVERQPLCDIRTTLVATLKPSLDGSFPDPVDPAVLLPGDRFLTWTRSQISVWGGSGEFLRSFGTAGFGPGEFAPLGITGVFKGEGDSIYVLDAAQRWSVFDAGFEFRRVFVGLGSGRDRQTMHVTPLGILTTGAVVQAETNQSFHIMSLDGSSTTSFGSKMELTDGAARLSNVRLSAHDGEGGFWVVPSHGGARGLTLEHWTLGGERRVTLERRVPWLPEGGYASSSDALEPRLPEYDMLTLDANGLLWLAVVVRDERWRSVTRAERRDVAPEELYDVRLEVIDPVAGVVLASLRLDGPADGQDLPVMFPGSTRGFSVSPPDSVGLTTLRILDVHLTSR